MATAGKSYLISVGFLVLLAGFSAKVWGQAAPNPSGIFGNLNTLTRIQGAIICVGCSLEEAQKGAGSGRLFELRNSQSTAILRVDEVEDAARWASITLGHRLSVRTATVTWQQLTAEENLFKEVEITGLMSSARTLDVSGVVAKEGRRVRQRLFNSEE
jgi:hypothetical protein